MKSIKSKIPERYLPAAKGVYFFLYRILIWLLTLIQRFVQTPILLLLRRRRTGRKMEIGPGNRRIDGFETLNIIGGFNVDYVWNAEKRLPFSDGSFELIYASHVLEHIPWYKTEEVLCDWVRVLAPGGRLELWIPDGLKICEAFVNAEKLGSRDFDHDGWYKFNPDHDPCVWVSGRVFSYGDGTGKRNHPNWHLAIFSYRYLEKILRRAGCTHVAPLERSAIRAYDHGWINLGIVGKK